MRTTIELPPDMRQKLIEEAAARHLRGFSPLVVEALRMYFSRQRHDRKTVIERLKGSLTAEQLDRERDRLREVRDNWRR